jgi:hypothetical protein
MYYPVRCIELAFKFWIQTCSANDFAILPTTHEDALWFRDVFFKIRPQPKFEEEARRVGGNLDTSTNLQSRVSLMHMSGTLEFHYFGQSTCLLIDGYIMVLPSQGNGCSKTTETGSNNDDLQFLTIVRGVWNTILEIPQKIKAVTWIARQLGPVH